MLSPSMSPGAHWGAGLCFGASPGTDIDLCIKMKQLWNANRSPNLGDRNGVEGS